MGELAKRLGDHVRALRLFRGLTQAELADRASISEEWLRRIERGGASPSFDTIEALAKALDVSVEAPLGVARDAEIGQRLAAASRRLDAAEQGWLIELIELVTRRPARLEPPAD